MTERFFTDHWYRVAGLRPHVPAHVQVERHRYGGQAWYALHDPLSSRVHRVTPSAYLFVARLDGRRTVDEVWQGMVAELDADAPGQEAVVQLLTQLHAADLLTVDVTPDAAELLSRRNKHSRSVWARNLRSPLSMQFPLIDPDRFLTRTLPLVRPLLGRVGFALWAVLIGAGLVTVGQHWAELSENVLDRVMATEGLLAMVLCYPVVKALHELGHGYVAKLFGCQVREMGLMLLVLFPVPYVDASPSAALRSKWQRAGVAAAGIAVELALASIAALVWASVEPGLLRAVAFNVMLIGGVSTLLINGNPFLRYDGYYVLADLLEVPNLSQRGNRYLGHLVNRYAFGVPGMRPFSATAWERAVMLVYAPLSWAYRMFIMAAVSMFVAANYFILGILAAVVSLVNGLLLPLGKSLWRVITAPAYRLRRGRAAGLTFGTIAAVAALLLTVPAPLHSTTEGVVWTPEDAAVRAATDGFVHTVLAEPGAIVQRGAVLLALDHPIADARLAVTAAHVDELQARFAAEWVTDRVTAEATRFELEQEEAVLARETVRQHARSVVAPAMGLFHLVRPGGDMQGRYVKEGEVLGYVTPVAGRVARIVVPQTDIGLVRDHLTTVMVRLGDRRTDLPSSMLRAVPSARDELPSAALGRTAGGQVSSDPRDNRGLKAFERQFQFDVSLPETDVVTGFGARVFVRLDYDWEPIGQILYRRVRQAFLTRFEA